MVGILVGTKDGLNVTMMLGLGLGLGLAIGIILGLKLTMGPMLGRILKIGPRLGLTEAPELGVALGLTDGVVLAPAEGVGVLPVPVLPDGELLACAVADANTVVVAYAVGSVVAASVGWAVFWPASAVGVAWAVAVGFVVAWDLKRLLISVQPDITKTDSNIAVAKNIDLFDNVMIMHPQLKFYFISKL